MNPLLLSTLLAAEPANPLAAEQPAAFDLLVSASSGPFQRASSPLRKHKRKAAPQRAALDGVPSAATDESGTESELESRASKERRGSASPDPVHSAATAAARSQRPQRAAAALSVQHPQAPAPLAPEDLAAVFEQPAAPAAPPAWLTAAAAPGAPKVCVQCGTTATPMWRQVNGLTYCNADGLRLKRKLGLL